MIHPCSCILWWLCFCPQSWVKLTCPQHLQRKNGTSGLEILSRCAETQKKTWFNSRFWIVFSGQLQNYVWLYYETAFFSWSSMLETATKSFHYVRLSDNRILGVKRLQCWTHPENLLSLLCYLSFVTLPSEKMTTLLVQWRFKLVLLVCKLNMSDWKICNCKNVNKLNTNLK